MWGRITELASAVTSGLQDEGNQEQEASSVSTSPSDSNDPSDLQIQLMEQERLVLQLKEMVRERETNLHTKDNELKKVHADLSKMKLQSKAKIVSLSQQLEEAKKVTADSADRASVDSDESMSTTASEMSSTVADQTSRARTRLLRKKLNDRDRKIEEKDAEVRLKQSEVEAKEKIIGERDAVVEALTKRLMEESEKMNARNADENNPILVDQIYAQMVHKDRRAVELDDRILELEKTLMDLRELVTEKDEVIRGRDKAIHLLQGTIAEKDSSVTDQVAISMMLAAKLERAERFLKNSNVAIDDSQVFDVTSEIGSLARSVELKNEECTRLANELTSTKDYLEEMSIRCTAAERALEVSRNVSTVTNISNTTDVSNAVNISEIKNEKADHVNEVKGLLSQIELLRAEVAQTQSENIAIKSELHDKTSQLERRETSSGDKNHLLSELELEIGRKDEELKRCRGKLEERMGLVRSLQDLLDVTNRSMQDLQESSARKSEEIDSLKALCGDKIHTQVPSVSGYNDVNTASKTNLSREMAADDYVIEIATLKEQINILARELSSKDEALRTANRGEEDSENVFTEKDLTIRSLGDQLEYTNQVVVDRSRECFALRDELADCKRLLESAKYDREISPSREKSGKNASILLPDDVLETVKEIVVLSGVSSLEFDEINSCLSRNDIAGGMREILRNVRAIVNVKERTENELREKYLDQQQKYVAVCDELAFNEKDKTKKLDENILLETAKASDDKEIREMLSSYINKYATEYANPIDDQLSTIDALWLILNNSILKSQHENSISHSMTIEEINERSPNSLSADLFQKDDIILKSDLPEDLNKNETETQDRLEKIENSETVANASIETGISCKHAEIKRLPKTRLQLKEPTKEDIECFLKPEALERDNSSANQDIDITGNRDGCQINEAKVLELIESTYVDVRHATESGDSSAKLNARLAKMMEYCHKLEKELAEKNEICQKYDVLITGMERADESVAFNSETEQQLLSRRDEISKEVDHFVVESFENRSSLKVAEKSENNLLLEQQFSEKSEIEIGLADTTDYNVRPSAYLTETTVMSTPLEVQDPTHQRNLEDLQRRLDEQTVKCKDLEQQLFDKHVLCESLELNNVEKTGSYAELDKRFIETNESLLSLRQEFEEKVVSRGDSERELTKKCEQLKFQLEEEITNYQQLEASILEIQSDCTDLNGRLTESKEFSTNLEQKLEIETANISNLDQQLTDKTNLIMQLEMQLTEKIESGLKVEEQLTEIREKCAQLELQFDEQSVKLRYAEQQLLEKQARCEQLESLVTENTTNKDKIWAESQDNYLRIVQELAQKSEHCLMLEQRLNEKETAYFELNQQFARETEKCEQLERQNRELTELEIQNDQQFAKKIETSLLQSAEKDENCSKLEKQLVQMREDCNRLEYQLADNSESLNRKTLICEELEQKLSEGADNYKTLQECLISKEADFINSTTETNTLKKLIFDLQNETVSVGDSLKISLEDEITQKKQLEANLEKEKERSDEIKQELVKISSELDASRIFNNELQLIVDNKECEIKEIQEKLLVSESAVLNFKTDLKEAQTSLEQVKIDLEIKTTEASQEILKCTNLQSELERSQQLYEDMQNRNGQENADHAKNLSEKDCALDELRSEVATKNEEISNLRIDILNKETALSEKDDELGKIKSELASSDKKISNMHIDILNKETALSEVSQQFSEKNASSQEYENSIKLKTDACEQLEKQLAESLEFRISVDELLKCSTIRCEELEVSLKTAVESQQEAERQLEDMIISCEQVQRQLDEETKIRSGLEQQLIEKQTHCDQFEASLAEKTSRCAELEKHSVESIENLQCQLAEKSQMCKQLEQELAEKSECCAQALQRVAETSEKCNQLAQNVVVHAEKIVQLEQNLTEQSETSQKIVHLEQNLAEKSETCSRLEQQIANHSEENTTVEQQLIETAERYSNVLKQCADSSEQFIQLKQQVTQSEECCEKYRHEIAQQAENCALLEKHIAEESQKYAQLLELDAESAEKYALLEQQLSHANEISSQFEKQLTEKSEDYLQLELKLIEKTAECAQIERELFDQNEKCAEFERDTIERSEKLCQVEQQLIEKAELGSQIENQLYDQNQKYAALEQDAIVKAEMFARIQQELTEKLEACTQIEKQLSDQTENYAKREQEAAENIKKYESNQQQLSEKIIILEDDLVEKNKLCAELENQLLMQNESKQNSQLVVTAKDEIIHKLTTDNDALRKLVSDFQNDAVSVEDSLKTSLNDANSQRILLEAELLAERRNIIEVQEVSQKMADELASLRLREQSSVMPDDIGKKQSTIENVTGQSDQTGAKKQKLKNKKQNKKQTDVVTPQLSEENKLLVAQSSALAESIVKAEDEQSKLVSINLDTNQKQEPEESSKMLEVTRESYAELEIKLARCEQEIREQAQEIINKTTDIRNLQSQLKTESVELVSGEKTNPAASVIWYENQTMDDGQNSEINDSQALKEQTVEFEKNKCCLRSMITIFNEFVNEVSSLESIASLPALECDKIASSASDEISITEFGTGTPASDEKGGPLEQENDTTRMLNDFIVYTDFEQEIFAEKKQNILLRLRSLRAKLDNVKQNEIKISEMVASRDNEIKIIAAEAAMHQVKFETLKEKSLAKLKELNGKLKLTQSQLGEETKELQSLLQVETEKVANLTMQLEEHKTCAQYKSVELEKLIATSRNKAEEFDMMIAEKNSQILSLSDILSQESSLVSLQKDEIQKLQDSLVQIQSDGNSVSATLSQEVDAANENISQLRNELRCKDEELFTYANKLAESDLEAARLSAEIAAMKNDLNTNCRDFSTQIASIEMELDPRKTDISELQRTGNSENNDIADNDVNISPTPSLVSIVQRSMSVISDLRLNIQEKVQMVITLNESLGEKDKLTKKYLTALKKVKLQLEEEKKKNLNETADSDRSSTEIENLKRELTSAESNLSEMMTKVENGEMQCRDKDREIEDITTQCRDKDREIEDIKTQCRDKDREIEDIKTQCRDKDREIERLSDANRVQTEEITRATDASTSEVSDFAIALRKLTSELEERDEELIRVSSQLASAMGDREEMKTVVEESLMKMSSALKTRDELNDELVVIQLKLSEVSIELKDNSVNIPRQNVNDETDDDRVITDGFNSVEWNETCKNSDIHVISESRKDSIEIVSDIKDQISALLRQMNTLKSMSEDNRKLIQELQVEISNKNTLIDNLARNVYSSVGMSLLSSESKLSNSKHIDDRRDGTSLSLVEPEHSTNLKFDGSPAIYDLDNSKELKPDVLACVSQPKDTNFDDENFTVIEMRALYDHLQRAYDEKTIQLENVLKNANTDQVCVAEYVEQVDYLTAALDAKTIQLENVLKDTGTDEVRIAEYAKQVEYLTKELFRLRSAKSATSDKSLTSKDVVTSPSSEKYSDLGIASPDASDVQSFSLHSREISINIKVDDSELLNPHMDNSGMQLEFCQIIRSDENMAHDDAHTDTVMHEDNRNLGGLIWESDLQNENHEIHKCTPSPLESYDIVGVTEQERIDFPDSVLSKGIVTYPSIENCTSRICYSSPQKIKLVGNEVNANVIHYQSLDTLREQLLQVQLENECLRSELKLVRTISASDKYTDGRLSSDVNIDVKKKETISAGICVESMLTNNEPQETIANLEIEPRVNESHQAVDVIMSESMFKQFNDVGVSDDVVGFDKNATMIDADSTFEENTILKEEIQALLEKITEIQNDRVNLRETLEVQNAELHISGIRQGELEVELKRLNVQPLAAVPNKIDDESALVNNVHTPSGIAYEDAVLSGSFAVKNISASAASDGEKLIELITEHEDNVERLGLAVNDFSSKEKFVESMAYKGEVELSNLNVADGDTVECTTVMVDQFSGGSTILIESFIEMENWLRNENAQLTARVADLEQQLLSKTAMISDISQTGRPISEPQEDVVTLSNINAQLLENRDESEIEKRVLEQSNYTVQVETSSQEKQEDSNNWDWDEDFIDPFTSVDTLPLVTEQTSSELNNDLISNVSHDDQSSSESRVCALETTTSASEKESIPMEDLETTVVCLRNDRASLWKDNERLSEVIKGLEWKIQEFEEVDGELEEERNKSFQAQAEKSILEKKLKLANTELERAQRMISELSTSTGECSSDKDTNITGSSADWSNEESNERLTTMHTISVSEVNTENMSNNVDLNQQFIQLRNEHSRVTLERDDLRTRFMNTEEVLSEHVLEHARILEDNEKLNDVLKTIKQECYDFNATVAENERLKIELENSECQLKAEFRKSETCEELKADVHTLRLSLGAREEEITRLNTMFLELNQELGDTVPIITERDALKSALQLAEQELAEQAVVLIQNQELRATVNSMKLEISDILCEKEELKAVVVNSERALFDLSQIRSENEELKIVIRNTEQSFEIINSERDKLEEDIEKQITDMRKLEAENGAMHAENSRLKHKVDRLADDLSRLANNVNFEVTELAMERQLREDRSIDCKITDERLQTQSAEVSPGQTLIMGLAASAPNITGFDGAADNVSESEQLRALRESEKKLTLERDELRAQTESLASVKQKMLLKLKQFKEKNDALQVTFDKMEEEMKSQIVKCSDLENENLHLATDAETLREKLILVEKVLEKEVTARCDVSEHSKELEREHQSCRKQIERLEVELAELEEQHTKVSGEKESHLASLSSLNETLETLNSELLLNRKSYEAKSADFDNLKEYNLKLAEEFESLIREHDAHRIEASELARHVSHLETELTTMREFVRLLETKNNEFETDHSRLLDNESSKDKLQKECDCLGKQLVDLKKELESKEVIIEMLESKNAVAETEMSKILDLKNRITKLEQERDDLVQRVTYLEEEREAKEMFIRTLESKNADAELESSKILELESNKTELEQEREDLVKRVTDLEKELTTAVDTIQLLRTDGSTQQNELIKLLKEKKDLEKMESILQEEKREQEEHVADLEERLSEMLRVQEDLEESVSSSSALHSQLVAAQKDRASLSDEVDGLSWKIQEYEEIKGELEEVNAKLFQTQSENSVLKKLLSTAESRADAMVVTNEKLRQTGSDEDVRTKDPEEKQEMNEMKSEIVRLTTELATLETKYSSLITENSSWAEQCGDLQSELRRLEQSVIKDTSTSKQNDSKDGRDKGDIILEFNQYRIKNVDSVAKHETVEDWQVERSSEKSIAVDVSMRLNGSESVEDVNRQKYDRRNKLIAKISPTSSDDTSDDVNSSFNRWQHFEYTPVHVTPGGNAELRDSNKYDDVDLRHVTAADTQHIPMNGHLVADLERHLAAEQSMRHELEETVSLLNDRLKRQDDTDDNDEDRTGERDPLTSVVSTDGLNMPRFAYLPKPTLSRQILGVMKRCQQGFTASRTTMCSLGRVRLRTNIFVAYLILLHIYVLFGCLLS